MYTARILSLQVPLLQILYFFGVIIVPIVAYRGARAYRDYFYPTGPFKAGQGFSYVVLLHVFGGILAFIPQYFYFRYAMPALLAAWEEALRTMPGATAQMREMILQMQGITPLAVALDGLLPDDHPGRDLGPHHGAHPTSQISKIDTWTSLS